MKQEIVDNLSLLESFNAKIAHFDKMLYCNCEGDQLGRNKDSSDNRVDSLTSIQIYEPISNVGFYIDVLTLRGSDRLVQILKSLFENVTFTFVFFEPVMDYLAIKELGIIMTRVYCIKTVWEDVNSRKYESMQDLVEKECSFTPRDIFEWQLEKHKSRVAFDKNDYSSIVKRPISPNHSNMALNDAYYLFLAHSRIQRRRTFGGIKPKMLALEFHEKDIRDTMTALKLKEIHELQRVYPNNKNVRQEFDENKLIKMLKIKKLRWLACGYIYHELSAESLTKKKKKRLNAALT